MKAIRLTTLPAGYGHQEVTAHLEDGRTFSATTNATHYTDYLNDEDYPEKSEEAYNQLIIFIQKENDLNEDWESNMAYHN